MRALLVLSLLALMVADDAMACRRCGGARWTRRYYRYSSPVYYPHSNYSSSPSASSSHSAQSSTRQTPAAPADRQMSPPPQHWVEDGMASAPKKRTEIAQADPSVERMPKTQPEKKKTVTKRNANENWEPAEGGGHYFLYGKGRWYVGPEVTYADLIGGRYNMNQLAYVDPTTKRLFWYATKSMGSSPSYYFGPREGGSGIALQTDGSINHVPDFGNQLGSMARHSEAAPELVN